jgi:nucleotide-binding universal stress UspA family protein
MTSNEQRMVVGFDNSEGARAALRWALETAAVDGSTVEAVAAWTVPVAPISPWSPMPVFDDPRLVTEFERETRAAADEVREDVAGAPPVRFRVVEGAAGPSIVETARGAHCLVVGRRGHGGFLGLLLGSVADYCARHATVPVALVPPDGVPSEGAVVAGVDGSDCAADALRWAAAEADRLGRPLVAVHAWSWLDQPGSFDPGFDEAAARRWAGGIVARVLGERPVEVVATNGLPAAVLMARSAAGDLVVVGSRGMGAVKQALLGSVSRQLSHHAPSTVVVVTPTAT